MQLLPFDCEVRGLLIAKPCTWEGDPLSERVVVVSFDDVTGVPIGYGSYAAEVIAEVGQDPEGCRATGTVRTVHADDPPSGGHGAVEGQGVKAGHVPERVV